MHLEIQKGVGDYNNVRWYYWLLSYLRWISVTKLIELHVQLHWLVIATTMYPWKINIQVTTEPRNDNVLLRVKYVKSRDSRQIWGLRNLLGLMTIRSRYGLYVNMLSANFSCWWSIHHVFLGNTRFKMWIFVFLHLMSYDRVM